MSRHCPPRFVVIPLVGVFALASCAAPTPPGSAGGGADGAGKSLVLGEPLEPGQFNPLTGHGQHGNSFVYDSLLVMTGKGDDARPALAPALAASLPTHSADGKTWTVPLRTGVTFTDGTTFGSEDVVATYRAVLDPLVAATVADDLVAIAAVDAVDAGTVRFTLKAPEADFPTRMLLPIAPSERVGKESADASPLAKAPVGTGPFMVEQITGERTVLRANPKHWRGKPEIDTLTLLSIPDDNARAQKLAAGELDGTVLAPLLAATLKDKPGLKHHAVRSTDFLQVPLPKDSPFAQDPVARRAMNLAVDRQAIVDKILGGAGRPAHTPISPELTDVYEPSATFPHDPKAAEQALGAAGWVKGADGVRAKGGARASFPLLYAADDVLRRECAQAFAADMAKIGIEVKLEGTTWEKIEQRLGKIALVLGGGRHPTSTDSLVYHVLHRRTPQTSSVYSNPGDYGSPQVDAALEEARRTLDPAARAQLYKTMQKAHVANPGMVFLVHLTHTYISKEGAPGSATSTILEPHIHSIEWGPWWNLGRKAS